MYVTKNHKLTCVPLAFLVLVCVTKASDVPRPRGVSLSRAPLYVPEKNFTCFDGSKEIPFSQINDDYCDCLDASDEPGTSACPTGSFYCTNAGHTPLNLPSSRVNDGICDCCDGTDEYDGRKTCENNCLEQGRAAREEAIRFAELIKAGQQLRAELIRHGVQMKEERRAKLTELEKNIAEAEKIKFEKETLKKEAEELENKALEYYRKLEEEINKQKRIKDEQQTRAQASEFFVKYDLNQDGNLEVSELLLVSKLDRDRNGEVTEDEVKLFIKMQDSINLEDFIEHSWKLVKPYLAMDSEVFKPLKIRDHTDEVHEEPSEAEENPEGDSSEGSEHEDLEEEDQEEEDEQEPPQPEQEVEEEEPIKYDDETQKLVDLATEARNLFTEAEQNVRNIQNEIQGIKDYLEKDFGPEEEFSTLQGQCFEYRDNEYVYRLCPFDKTVQQSLSGGSETRLGGWSKWNGPEHNIYESMLYDKGVSCWNGPQRFTNVRITCGSENKLVSVSEPNRCEYFFEFITPAACRELPAEDQSDVHDEL